jgi:nucleoid DNA-binding protein
LLPNAQRRGTVLVTKKEIVKQISERANLTQLKTKEIVQWTFDAIIETLATEGRIELRNFGVFEVRERKARKARNPRTGDPVEVQPKNVVTFQPGKEMEERVKTAKAVAPKRKPRKDTDDDIDESLEAPIPDSEPAAVPVGAGVGSDRELVAQGASDSAGDGVPLKPR